MNVPHHQVIGSGRPVVMLHGGTGSSETYWKGQVDELSQSFQLILMDHRGFGHSADVGQFSIEACAADVVHVLNRLEHEQADLVGLSLGGAIAMQTALDAPDRVRRLVLADTFSCVNTQRFRRFIDYALIGSLQAGGFELMANINLIFAHGESFLESLKAPVAAGETWLQDDIDNYIDALRKIRDWDVDDRLSQILAPSLVVWGEDDIEVPRSYAENLAEKLPKAIMTVLPDAGHKVCADKPELFNKVVRTFLS